MDQYKCSKIARQKCPDREICGEGTYTGTECECAKFNEKCLPTKQRNIISELRDENATLKKALEMAVNPDNFEHCNKDCSGKYSCTECIIHQAKAQLTHETHGDAMESEGKK